MSAVPESSNSTCDRTTRYTPAVTIVAAWISAETGVGPSIASGSQTCRGSCADLPIAPASSSREIAVAAPWVSSLARSPNTTPKSSVPSVHPDQDDAEQHRRVPDARRDECLLRRARGERTVVPEADQQVRAQAHALPPQVQQEVVVREDQHQHEEDEQVEVREERSEPRIVLHVPDGVQVDQRADPGDHERHRDRERVGSEGDVDREGADRDPVEEVRDVDAFLGGEREQVEEHRDGEHETQRDQRRREPSGRPAQPASRGGRGLGGTGSPQRRRAAARGSARSDRARAYPRSTVRSSTFELCRRR